MSPFTFPSDTSRAAAEPASKAQSHTHANPHAACHHALYNSAPHRAFNREA